MVDCPHTGNCKSYPHKCDTCRHNKGRKKDYYKPDNPWEPYWDWYYPYWRRYPTITTDKPIPRYVEYYC